MILEFFAKAALIYGLVIWAGGLIHLLAAAIPSTALVEDRMLRMRLMAGMMKRFNPAAWTGLTALTVSATYLVLSQNIELLQAAVLTALYSALILDFLHSFIFGPKASSGDAAARRKALTIARLETPIVFILPILLTALL